MRLKKQSVCIALKGASWGILGMSLNCGLFCPVFFKFLVGLQFPVKLGFMNLFFKSFCQNFPLQKIKGRPAGPSACLALVGPSDLLMRWLYFL